MTTAATYRTQGAPTGAPAGAAPQSGVAIAPVLLGRREQQHGSLRSISDIHLATIVEAVDDLAVADRVAYVLARRTGIAHVVVTASQTWLVATTNVELSGADGVWITPAPGPHRIVSIATSDGVTPLLVPA